MRGWVHLSVQPDASTRGLATPVRKMKHFGLKWGINRSRSETLHDVVLKGVGGCALVSVLRNTFQRSLGLKFQWRSRSVEPCTRS